MTRAAVTKLLLLVILAFIICLPEFFTSYRDEWKCIIRIVWLVLLCVVLLTIATLVVKQIYRGKHLFANRRQHPDGFSTSQQLNDVRRQIQTVAKRGSAVHTNNFPSLSELSPIEEADYKNGVETLLDGNINHCYLGNLHHRSHSFLPTLTEEQPH